MSGHMDDIIKPSRLNRRKKRGWKISGLLKYGLTGCFSRTNLYSLAQHVPVWFGSHKTHKMPMARLICGLRFLEQKFYGGRYLGSFGSHGSCAMSTNPDNVHRQSLVALSGVLKHSQEVNTMSQNNSAQNPLKALFSIYHNRKLIAFNVPGTHALHLKQSKPTLIVKFDRMGGAA